MSIYRANKLLNVGLAANFQEASRILNFGPCTMRVQLEEMTHPEWFSWGR